MATMKAKLRISLFAIMLYCKWFDGMRFVSLLYIPLYNLWDNIQLIC